MPASFSPPLPLLPRVPSLALLDLDPALLHSDSANDLPLLRAVGHPGAVDPEERLKAEAIEDGWPIVQFERPGAASRAPAEAQREPE